MNPSGVAPWVADWVWSLPLIVMTVVIHVCGLAFVGERVVVLSQSVDSRRFILKFARILGTTALLATTRHGIEAAIWASAYWLLGALPDRKSAMLYSLSAMTTYGHASVYLEARWQLMGALEALNGILLFGITTAFMFAIIQTVWPLGSRTGSATHN